MWTNAYYPKWQFTRLCMSSGLVAQNAGFPKGWELHFGVSRPENVLEFSLDIWYFLYNFDMYLQISWTEMTAA